MAAPDFDALGREAVDTLQEYIRVDTSNPPGNEERAADFLAARLAAEGIESRKLLSAPGRANLYARLGDGPEKPLVLLNHLDVVPVEREHWHADPFGGEVRDGYIWGRGTLDMKGMATLELLAVLNLKRRGLRLRRPVVFLGVADEEAGSEYGVEWLDREHPDLIEGAAFVINEGGYGADSYLGVDRPIFGISMAEKSPLWLKLSTAGRAGHGSAPHDDNSVDRIVAAMHRIQHLQRPPILTEPVLDSLRAAHAAGFISVDPEKASPSEIVDRYRPLRVLMTNTISATGLRAGVKHNVIPASAEATIDCRLVPGYDPFRFISELERVVDDPKIKVETVFASASPSTSPDTDLFRAIEAVCREVRPDAPLLPRVSAGFTDSRTFRRRGVPAYGFVPMMLGNNELGGQHGNDEKVAVANLRLGVEVLCRVVERVCVGE